MLITVAPLNSTQLGPNFSIEKSGNYLVTVSALTGPLGATGQFQVGFGDSGVYYFGGDGTGGSGSISTWSANTTIFFQCIVQGGPQVPGDPYAGVGQVFYYAYGSTNSEFVSFTVSSIG